MESDTMYLHFVPFPTRPSEMPPPIRNPLDANQGRQRTLPSSSENQKQKTNRNGWIYLVPLAVP